jgi:hypothetical protein
LGSPFASPDAYTTGLTRYDPPWGGAHSERTADCRSKLQRKLTRKTLAARRKLRRRKTLFDHLIEEKQSRPVPPEEFDRLKSGIGTNYPTLSQIA